MAQSNHDDEVTFDLGGRSAVWRMPSIVHRFEAIERLQAGSVASAKAYSLVSGLPAGHLRGLGCPPTLTTAADVYADKLAELGGRAVLDYLLASSHAFVVITSWYVEMTKTEEARGNSEPVPAEAAAVDEAGETPATPTASAPSAEVC